MRPRLGGHEVLRDTFNHAKPKVLWLLRLSLVLCFLITPQFVLPHKAAAGTLTASDDFNRADGSLGPNWTAISDGAMAISSQAVTGTVNVDTGEIRTAETYASDQYSQIEVTSTQLTGGQWIGPAVRLQSSGQDGYLGIYYWNFGNPQLRLYVRNAGSYTQLGSSYSSGALAAGTQLEVTAVGSTISFLENGVSRISVTDSTFTGGAPGIMAHGNPLGDNWSGGSGGSGGGTAAYSVGGSVSGLSGTVVLQDNGGDDLSVSGNGSFTFNTPVTDGAGYQVTVKTYPSGQSCAVSGGSGTVAGANVTNVAVSCTSNSATSASDDFNRADGSLGPNWTAISDGAMAISSQAVTGTVNVDTGEIRTAETYASDQYSQIEVTSTQLTGGQWIGPAVRLQSSGQDGYLGIYYWNFGNPQLRLYVRNAGSYTQLGSSYSSGALAAGTQLRLVAAGNTIAFLENGVQRIAVTDGTFTGGAPGIMAHGNPLGDNWSGGSGGSGGGTAAYSVGGSVSGLSGTVVLQDNGGDDLSVSGNGSFTFNTPVTDGAGYQVTVRTNPSGQSCAVSGGSGTVAGANVTNVAVSCTSNSATSASDDFNRADGSLGPNWTAISDGAMAISSQAVTGTVNVDTGEIRTAETYASDQYSQIEVTSTQLTGGQWIGPAVRLQSSGQDGYLGIYYWNFGNPQLRLYVRNAGSYTQLGSSYSSGALAAGTQLEVTAVGSTISFLENGVSRISVTDSTFTGGAPGIMAHGNPLGDNWSGGSGGPARYRGLFGWGECFGAFRDGGAAG